MENDSALQVGIEEVLAERADDIIRVLMSGRLDQDLHRFKKAIKVREDQIAQARAMSLQVGDRVEIQGLGAGAKYLNGAPGTVVSFLQKNIRVRIDASWDTRRYGHELRIPPKFLRLRREEPAGEITA